MFSIQEPVRFRGAGRHASRPRARPHGNSRQRSDIILCARPETIQFRFVQFLRSRQERIGSLAVQRKHGLAADRS
jgi:hypothetical protein